MVILLGNQKGGVGKSTLTTLLANYLALVHDLTVTVVDMDIQRSVEFLYNDAKKLENEELYEVIGSDLKHFPAMHKAIFSKNPKDIVIIDLPGKLDDNELKVVFEKSDLLICPFIYEKMTLESTVVFSMVVQQINKKMEIHYVPMRIKGTVKYATEIPVNEALATIGNVTPSIPDKQIFQTISTYDIPKSLYPDILPALDDIYEKSIKPFINKE